MNPTPVRKIGTAREGGLPVSPAYHEVPSTKGSRIPSSQGGTKLYGKAHPDMSHSKSPRPLSRKHIPLKLQNQKIGTEEGGKKQKKDATGYHL